MYACSTFRAPVTGRAGSSPLSSRPAPTALKATFSTYDLASSPAEAMGTAEHLREHFVLSETIFSAARPATEMTVMIWQSAAGLHGQVEALASSSFSCSCAAATSGTAVRHGHTAGGGVRGRAAAAGARAGAPSCTLQTMSAAGCNQLQVTHGLQSRTESTRQPLVVRSRHARRRPRDATLWCSTVFPPSPGGIPSLWSTTVHAPTRPAERPPSPANTQPGRHPQLVLVLLQRRS